MEDNKISWSIPVLICAAILVIIYCLSTLLGVRTFDIIDAMWRFLGGSALGYVVWLLM